MNILKNKGRRIFSMRFQLFFSFSSFFIYFYLCVHKVPVRGNNKMREIGREAYGNKRGTSEIRFLLGGE